MMTQDDLIHNELDKLGIPRGTVSGSPFGLWGRVSLLGQQLQAAEAEAARLQAELETAREALQRIMAVGYYHKDPAEAANAAMDIATEALAQPSQPDADEPTGTEGDKQCG